ncbi:hypothetical protein FOCC_FOCC006060 [Frankliniella occidentalis]|nr:hypothetical protein FOCC_FOCC006060 [Frankliniella occidentalis]
MTSGKTDIYFGHGLPSQPMYILSACHRRILKHFPYFLNLYQPTNFLHRAQRLCSESVGSVTVMKILNVAEKNDAAKNIANHLGGGNVRRRDGFSKFNKIYEFDYNVRGQNSQMVMTSVSGHMLALDFNGQYRNWRGCNPLSLFDAPVVRYCPKDYENIKRTIEREVRSCQMLIIWTDCDREGENIGFEIIDTCLAVKANLQVFRAKFSEITAPSIRRAINTLEAPNKLLSDAVSVRSELDLRIGAAFTRFQTLRLQKVFPQKLKENLISYGSCQFPTLGFVVERYKSIERFIPEQFWKLTVNHTIDDLTVEFSWKRVRLFDELACKVLLDTVQERTEAVVEKVVSKPKSKWRPVPLDTIELEKLGSRKLKINAKETMRVAERLYTQGLISYPRTETNIFPKNMNLGQLVEMQTQDNRWGAFAQSVLAEGPNPRQGKKTDEAHPPIHPTKYTDNLQGNEGKVYEFIVRHFLACCSKDAQAHETIVDIDINGEKFVASGLRIIARNYLDVYPYENWKAKEIHPYEEAQHFQPSKIEMSDGNTAAPKPLTEADLIALMEKHGIGTDATHADHIETIKNRAYVGLDNNYFLPGELGLGLVDGYDSMGFSMSKPNLRAELEADLQRIANGTRDAKDVLADQLRNYRTVFEQALEQAAKIDIALAQYLNEERQPATEAAGAMIEIGHKKVCVCPSCGQDMVLRSKNNNPGYFISCMGFPDCIKAIWFPSFVEHADVSEELCNTCNSRPQKLKFRFKRGACLPLYPDNYEGCVGGCDVTFIDKLSIRPISDLAGTNSVAPRPTIANLGNNQRNPPIANIGNNQRNPPSPPNRSSGISFNNRQPKPTNSASGGNSASNASGLFQNRQNSVSSDNLVVCKCNIDAIQLTVRKDGPNQGRQFYKCGNNGGCDFFMWADETAQCRKMDLTKVVSFTHVLNLESLSATFSNGLIAQMVVQTMGEVEVVEEAEAEAEAEAEEEEEGEDLTEVAAITIPIIGLEEHPVVVEEVEARLQLVVVKGSVGLAVKKDIQDQNVRTCNVTSVKICGFCGNKQTELIMN